ncbi:hypothetical protein AX15_001215 [Amanita polypyramis BW_CC]|nr:hypothetical protein AX15_001215 [Amanita polypyramis BW_CC]
MARLQPQQLFTNSDGEPIRFFIHECVNLPGRPELRELVEEHGGEIVDTDKGVDTVIVDDSYPFAQVLQNAYFLHPNRNNRRTRVEDVTFIEQCITTRVFQHRPVGRFPMRGNDEYRTSYTEADEENLCRYLAMKIPDPKSGGRLGHKIYKDMVELALVMPQEYAWVIRHPPESWREHYRNKKNRERLDAMIEQFRHEEHPTWEQLYKYDRTLNQRRSMVHRLGRSPESGEAFDSHWEANNGRIPPESYRRQSPGMRREEEESNPEDPSDESDDAHPSSLFSVDINQGRQPEQKAIATSKQIAVMQRPVSSERHRTLNEPSTSQATTVVAAASQFQTELSPVRLSDAVVQQPSGTLGEMVIVEPDIQPGAIQPTTSTPLQDRPRAKKKRAKKVSVEVPVRDAPYRNTRARSRSVETPPITDVVPARLRGLRKRRRVKPTHELLQDLALEEKRDHLEPISVPEAVEEEADVAQLLIAETNGEFNGEVAHQHQQPVAQPSGNENVQEEGSRHLQQALETDDEQIDRKLSSLSSNTSGHTRSDYDAIDPRKLLKEFRDSTASDLQGTPIWDTRSLLLPTREQDDNAFRESSEESFPRQDTRASVVKKRIQEKQKKQEYIPPPNTRAARFAERG